ncbi:MAG: 1-acyl-sn-glycerol-3-phosphate acyltransferase [Mariniphaga sp.]|nr:1-acyl-sn-glycerol-3-phosphate acyltransferase [Mariniphaga sp.]MDD4225670.1 1-acyl-sn-glycerol-3-phosphate acyltransferase [Mariniphaga sp.]
MLLQKICKWILRVLGWKSIGELSTDPRIIIIGFPHTSGWDFIISWIFYISLGGTANILIKREFFFWPVGLILKKMGGIPIDRSKGANVIRQVIRQFNEREYMHLAITPEGTRKRTKRWKAGFHTIARTVGIPVFLSTFDWGRKEMTIWGQFELTDDAQADIQRLKDFLREKGIRGKHPDQFTTDY